MVVIDLIYLMSASYVTEFRRLHSLQLVKVYNQIKPHCVFRMLNVNIWRPESGPSHLAKSGANLLWKHYKLDFFLEI